MVQSTCLTSRGSLVRIQYLPQPKTRTLSRAVFLCPKFRHARMKRNFGHKKLLMRSMSGFLVGYKGSRYNLDHEVIHNARPHLIDADKSPISSGHDSLQGRANAQLNVSKHREFYENYQEECPSKTKVDSIIAASPGFWLGTRAPDTIWITK